MSRVAAVVVNWQQPELTLQCLDSLPALGDDCATFVVDNGSRDDSVDTIADWCRDHFAEASPQDAATARAVTVALDQNRGFAAGNNAALELILAEDRFDWVWLLNNDTRAEPEALAALLERARSEPRLGIVGSTLLRPDGRIQCAGGYRYQPALTTISAQYGNAALADIAEADERALHLDYIAGASMLIRTALLRETGLLDERFFLYCEELDLARRAQTKGWELGWAKRSRVVHIGGATTGSRRPGEAAGTTLAALHENLSALRYTWKHHPWLLPVALPGRLGFKTISILQRRAWREFAPLVRACGQFLIQPGGRPSRAAATPRITCYQ